MGGKLEGGSGSKLEGDSGLAVNLKVTDSKLEGVLLSLTFWGVNLKVTLIWSGMKLEGDHGSKLEGAIL